MAKNRWNGPGLLFLGGVVLLGAVFGPKLFQTQRIAGLYHVDGGFTDWRFGSDGSLKEEGLIPTSGHWKLGSGDRIDIDHGFGPWVTYRYHFEGKRLVLVGNGITWGLTPKD